MAKKEKTSNSTLNEKNLFEGFYQILGVDLCSSSVRKLL